jgi:hypothetical protein
MNKATRRSITEKKKEEIINTIFVVPHPALSAA